MAGVKVGCVHCVIPYGKWHSVAVSWNTSINGYTVPLPFTFYKHGRVLWSSWSLVDSSYAVRSALSATAGLLFFYLHVVVLCLLYTWWPLNEWTCSGKSQKTPSVSYLTAGFCRKNLAFARKIKALPESGGLQPSQPPGSYAYGPR